MRRNTQKTQEISSSQPRRRERSAFAIAELIEQLSRQMASRSLALGLNAAQWAALRYVARANASARNIGAFAKFHLTTPSSASQTIMALVNKGLVAKTAGTDGRRRLLALTDKGRRKLAQDPIGDLVGALQALSDGQLFLLAETLDSLTRAAATKR